MRKYLPLTLSALFLAGCALPRARRQNMAAAQDIMRLAEADIQEARLAEASTYAVVDLLLAQVELEQAEEMLAKKRYAKAKRHAENADLLGRRALKVCLNAKKSAPKSEHAVRKEPASGKPAMRAKPAEKKAVMRKKKTLKPARKAMTRRQREIQQLKELERAMKAKEASKKKGGK